MLTDEQILSAIIDGGAASGGVMSPLGDQLTEAEEMAAAVAFLASDDASFITAATFLVDGGISSAYVTPL